MKFLPALMGAWGLLFVGGLHLEAAALLDDENTSIQLAQLDRSPERLQQRERAAAWEEFAQRWRDVRRRPARDGDEPRIELRRRRSGSERFARAEEFGRGRDRSGMPGRPEFARPGRPDFERFARGPARRGEDFARRWGPPPERFARRDGMPRAESWPGEIRRGGPREMRDGRRELARRDDTRRFGPPMRGDRELVARRGGPPPERFERRDEVRRGGPPDRGADRADVARRGERPGPGAPGLQRVVLAVFDKDHNGRLDEQERSEIRTALASYRRDSGDRREPSAQEPDRRRERSDDRRPRVRERDDRDDDAPRRRAPERD